MSAKSGTTKKKSAKENEDFDAFLKDLQKTTKQVGTKKAQEEKKKPHALTQEERLAAHKQRHDAIEKAKQAEFQRVLERQQQQRMIQQMLQQLQMGGGFGQPSHLLNKPSTDITIDAKKNASFDVVSGGMQGWRRVMEDAHIIDLDLEKDGKTGIFAVFDGHAGEKCSLACQKVLPALIRLHYKDGNVNFPAVYADLDKGMRAKLTDESGSTAVVVVVTPTTITCANVGDSRAVLCNNGKAIALSEDHKPESEEEATRIKEAGGFVQQNRVNGQLAMSRAIGDFTYKGNEALPADKQLVVSTPDVVTRPRDAKDEFLLVACDGIWDVLSNDQAVELVRSKLAEGLSVEEVTKFVLNRCLVAESTTMPGMPAEAEGTDNMTLTIVKLL